MKILIYDVETTGLDSQKSAIHQLSGKVVIDGEVKETFNLKLCPHEGADITDEDIMREGIVHAPIQAQDVKTGEIGDFAYLVISKKRIEHIVYSNARDAFAGLIDAVCGKGTWESNPWVWVFDYKLIEK